MPLCVRLQEKADKKQKLNNLTTKAIQPGVLNKSTTEVKIPQIKNDWGGFRYYLLQIASPSSRSI